MPDEIKITFTLPGDDATNHSAWRAQAPESVREELTRLGSP